MTSGKAIWLGYACIATAAYFELVLGCSAPALLLWFVGCVWAGWAVGLVGGVRHGPE